MRKVSKRKPKIKKSVGKRVTKKVITPSEHPFSALVLCPPTYVDTGIRNNAWMTDGKTDITLDKEKFMGEWYNLYQILTANAIVYLIPPKKGLQDQTYVNSFVKLHNTNTCILSNFTAEGRSGEEDVTEAFLKDLGYDVVKSPYKFEGYPELKYSGKDNIYYGGHGIRTDVRTYDWLEDNYDVKIIRLKAIDPYLYHLDTSLFVLNRDNIMLCSDVYSKKELREISKVANIHSITVDSAYQGICNSIKVGDFIVNGSSLDYMQPKDKWYKEEETKNEELERVCDDVGLELVFVSIQEAMKSGALASCFAAPLNYKDLLY